MIRTLIIRQLGRRYYEEIYAAMKNFTDLRSQNSCDEIWLVEHHPVFTLGRRGDVKHIHDAGNIPVIHADRGGQVTYHGPGQLVVYLLLDLQRQSLGIRSLVDILQESVITLLIKYGINSSSRANAPGVYVNGRKIASIGLRVRRGCCYHGIGLNVAMDLTPFKRIDPCGYAGLEVTQISDLHGPDNLTHVAEDLVNVLQSNLAYDKITMDDEYTDNDPKAYRTVITSAVTLKQA